MNEQPVPQGNYRPAIRHGDLIFTSGMTPREAGVLIHTGRIRADDPLESHRDAVRLATKNALIAAKSCLDGGENVERVLQLNVFLNTESDFTDHPKIADFASDFLVEHIGVSSIGTRAAVGVNSLPSNATVEVVLVCSVAK